MVHLFYKKKTNQKNQKTKPPPPNMWSKLQVPASPFSVLNSTSLKKSPFEIQGKACLMKATLHCSFQALLRNISR